MRAAVSVRVSKLRTDDPSTSPEVQEAAGRRWAAAVGALVVAVEQDLDLSARSLSWRERPGIMRLARMAQNGEIQRLVVSRLDRAGRNVRDTLDLVDTLKAAGAALVIADINIDAETSAGKMFLTNLASFAEYEGNLLSEKLTVSHETRAKAGRFRGGETGFCYASAPRAEGGRTLVVNTDRAALVTHVALERLRGASWGDLARWMQERTPPARAAEWSAPALRQLLLNDSLLGYAKLRGEVVRDKHGMPVQAYPPAIEPALWHQLQAREATSTSSMPEAVRGGVRRTRYWSQQVLCSGCGRPMNARKGTTTNKGPIAYCATRSRGRECSRSVTIGLDVLEADIERLILETVGDHHVYEVVDDDTLRERQVEEAQVREALVMLGRDLADADDDALDELLARRKALRTRLGELTNPTSPDSARGTALRPTGRLVRDDWQTADDLGRAILLTRYAERITVLPGRRGVALPGRVVIDWTPAASVHEDAEMVVSLAGEGVEVVVSGPPEDVNEVIQTHGGMDIL